MSQSLKCEDDGLVADVLLEIASALSEGAAGPCDYWYKVLAERLHNRALARIVRFRQSVTDEQKRAKIG